MVSERENRALGMEMGGALKLWRVLLGDEHLFNRPSTSPVRKVSNVRRTSPADAQRSRIAWASLPHVTRTVSSSVDVDSRLQSFRCLLPASIRTSTSSHLVHFLLICLLCYLLSSDLGPLVSFYTIAALGASSLFPPSSLSSTLLHHPNNNDILRV